MTVGDLHARFAEIARVLPGAQSEWYAVYCNGCGRIEGSHSVEGLIPKLAGWEIGPDLGDADLCPSCRLEGEGWAGSFPRSR